MNSIKGRGAASNPPNRFEPLHFECEPDEGDDTEVEPSRAPATELIADASRSVIASNDSPDIGFEVSLNPYRGCEHGCVYCYARPFHEYLGYSAGLDFETKILHKPDAPELLRRELSSPRWVPRVMALSGVTDAYQPAERELRLTRGCLQVLAEFHNPVAVVTKSALVTRDIDILQELARHRAVSVCLSITTLDRKLARRMEPRASLPAQRLAAIEALAKAEIPVGVMTAPVIPGLTEHEIPNLLEAAAKAGARFAGYIMLRLPGAVATLFTEWLDSLGAERKERVLGRIRAMRNGRLNDPRFGHRMRGQGPLAEAIETLFDASCRRYGLSRRGPALSTASFRRPGSEKQALLFDA
jgi:DNA repair photolyase